MLDTLIYNPLTNLLLLIYELLFHNYLLAIVVLTLLIRLVTLPLTLKQQSASMRMSAMQPLVKEAQEKYKGDPKKLQEEMRRLGFNPLSGCLPTVIQFPILIGLYQAINRTLAFSPLSLLELGKHIYGFLPNLSPLVPVNSTIFGIFDMGAIPALNSITVIIPLLVVATTWLSSKMMQMPSTDPQQQQTMKMMNLMMPMMIGFFSLQTPIGLATYWIVSNVIGVGQYYLLKPQMDALKAKYATPAGSSAGAVALSMKSGSDKPLFAPPKSKVKAKSSVGNKPAANNKSGGNKPAKS